MDGVQLRPWDALERLLGAMRGHMVTLVRIMGPRAKANSGGRVGECVIGTLYRISILYALVHFFVNCVSGNVVY